MSAVRTLRAHWPEYLIEGWALGMFMISAGVITTLFDYPGSPVNRALHDSDLQRVLIGACMGLTAMALIYSPWGKRSGAHMNPAVTLTFLRLGHVARWDALFYIVAQFIGGTLGVLLVWMLLGEAFANPPIRYVATLPGAHGVSVALLAEFVISFVMMTTILRVSNSQRLMRYTGICAGVLVAIWIGIEGSAVRHEHEPRPHVRERPARQCLDRILDLRTRADCGHASRRSALRLAAGPQRSQVFEAAAYG